MRLRIRYNSPVILTFTFAAVAVLLLCQLSDDFIRYFAAYPSFDPPNILYFVGFVTHILGHANWQHLSGNFLIVLLIGPLLEERHGSISLLQMIVVTALVTSVCNALFFSAGLIGASGIVFMLILLGSFSNFKRREVPLTFILVAVFFLGKEIIAALDEDNISQFAHIIGGLIGAGFGFLWADWGGSNRKTGGGKKESGHSEDPIDQLLAESQSELD